MDITSLSLPAKHPIPSAFSGNAVSILFSCDNNFVPLLSVTLQSLLEHASDDNNYDIVLFDGSITNMRKEMLISQIQGRSNISLRFFPISEFVQSYDCKTWWLPGYHKTHSVYYPLFAPIVFSQYQKIIYTDVDLVYMEDIANLYNIDIGSNLIAAVRDFSHDRVRDQTDNKKYLHDILGIKDLSKYFNSGVYLSNIAEVQRRNIFQKYSEFANINNKLYAIQNVLNASCQGSVYYLDETWNVVTGAALHPDETSMSQETFSTILRNAKIVHFAGGKPTSPSAYDPYAIWWEYARKTPFYEILFQNRIESLFKKDIQDIKKKQQNLEKSIQAITDKQHNVVTNKNINPIYAFISFLKKKIR